ncbi:hypothetical protein KR054_001423 [Drosophila jambulina]|nr:hypothetical protein KR054_001423 [Drosophila jambulina]
MRIDLKALLLISTSAAPDSVIHMNKRFQVGKVSFMVRYELRKGELIIRHMKKVRFGSALASRPKKRQRGQQRKLEPANTSVKSSNQILLPHSPMAVGTEGLVLATTASQTSRRELSSTQMDTSDLFLTFSKDQQTTSCEIQSSGSQTEEQALLSRSTQAKITAKSWSTQTRIQNASLGSQTENFCNNVGVQGKIDGTNETTQTDEVEQQLIRPYLQALVLESIKNMSSLISSEVISAVSQVLDIRALEMKKMTQELDLPREGALEPLTPLPVCDKLSSEKFLTVASIRTHSFTPRRLIKAKRFSAGHSWNCTSRCKPCGLHMHRNRVRLSIDSHSTQTEEEKESKMAKVSVEMATQTEKLEKERCRWTLKRI